MAEKQSYYSNEGSQNFPEQFGVDRDIISMNTEQKIIQVGTESKKDLTVEKTSIELDEAKKDFEAKKEAMKKKDIFQNRMIEAFANLSKSPDVPDSLKNVFSSQTISTKIDNIFYEVKSGEKQLLMVDTMLEMTKSIEKTQISSFDDIKNLYNKNISKLESIPNFFDTTEFKYLLSAILLIVGLGIALPRLKITGVLVGMTYLSGIVMVGLPAAALFDNWEKIETKRQNEIIDILNDYISNPDIKQEDVKKILDSISRSKLNPETNWDNIKQNLINNNPNLKNQK